ncbi:MAG: right-handed parallel beta-helix repeat-containing protein [Planctomycetota bacterium JB042]
MLRPSFARAAGSTVLALVVAAPAPAASYEVKPPLKIQDAVDAALANGDAVDVIFVQPGTYDEAVSIDYALAPGQTSLSLVRTKFPRPEITGGLVVKDARLVSIVGFRIDSPHGDGLSAVRIVGSQAVTIAHCVGTPGDDGGVHATGSVRVTVDGGQWASMLTSGGGSGDGVRIVGGCDHVVRGSETKNNKGVGVRIEAPLSLVKKVTATGNAQGGIVIDGLNNEVKSVVAKGNGGAGIVVRGVCAVSKSSVRKNDGAGIEVGDGGAVSFTGGVVEDNTIAKNGGPGLHVREDQHGLLIEKNGVTGNDGAGIRIHSDAHRVTANVAESNGGGHGIVVLGGATSNCLTDNKVSSNSGEGIRIEGDDNLLVGNVAKGDDGIVSASGATGNQGHANKTASGKNDFP